MRSECLAALGLVLVIACHHDDKNACVEGASVACACADGASGAQVCKANGAYGACQLRISPIVIAETAAS